MNKPHLPATGREGKREEGICSKSWFVSYPLANGLAIRVAR